MKLYTVVIGAFGIASVFILTAFISLPIANLGYINLGDAMIMLFCSFFEASSLGFLVSGLASALSDLYLGFSQYALFTLLIKGCEGALIVLLRRHRVPLSIAYLAGGLIVVIGYGLTDVFLTMQWASLIPSMAMNLIQISVSVLIASLLSKPFMKAVHKLM